MKLVVFDLDGTLARTNRADGDCFVQAFAEALDLRDLNTNWSEYEHVTDEGVTRQIFAERFGRHPAPEEISRVMGCFLDLLRARSAADAEAFTEVPGARSLIEDLAGRSGWAMALATGAWRRSAEFKIGRAGLPVGDIPSAFAEDGPSREAIVRAAVDRARSAYRQPAFERIVSVGDALWDVRTARILNLPFLGIASGARAIMLRNHGATHVIQDYRDAPQCLRYLDEAQPPVDYNT